jgi:hypothetical protein
VSKNDRIALLLLAVAVIVATALVAWWLSLPVR